ncbi:hypothetical protein RLW55_15365 [Hyphomicrobium sp. B1]|jgi:hypothetical protein|uniref:hypothetical protein n=1 Tax=unclassified Hyphomicrobium TaxID=2619925 RepID=UPI000213E3F6|nr:MULTISPECIES: hypothetical protein [unclassified Hyphomicrobium]CCB65268.1 conserved protein of unknown function [Hyphomicrobium sp. MC1]
MKYAAYTEETIWAVADDEETAREEGEENMAENGVTDTSALKVAPIDDNLVEALEEAEESGADVLFDLIDGELCEVETVEG